ncbi:hypothetical protein HanPI659440_Chr10g0372781 [Helianthus annuus]|nr:hypothetical protein HanPI659440_Chr10g0372781 [Helianthus annuus]
MSPCHARTSPLQLTKFVSLRIPCRKPLVSYQRDSSVSSRHIGCSLCIYACLLRC